MINASLQAIKAFEAAARLGSFKAAAEEMAITPAGVSHHISNLEHRVGVPLFIRQHRKITLTDEGQQLAVATSEGLQKIQTALEDIRKDATSIKVDTTSSFAALVLIPLLNDFHGTHPDIDIEISTGETVAVRINTLSIRMGSVNLVEESKILTTERFNLYGAPSFIRSINRDAPVSIFVTQWKNRALPDAPWNAWLAENAECFQIYELKYFDQELYGIYEALAGRGLVFCSETLANGFVNTRTLQPITPHSVESALGYYIPTHYSQHSVKAQAFIHWLKNKIN